jgi:hypothetical protein
MPPSKINYSISCEWSGLCDIHYHGPNSMTSSSMSHSTTSNMVFKSILRPGLQLRYINSIWTYRPKLFWVCKWVTFILLGQFKKKFWLLNLFLIFRISAPSSPWFTTFGPPKVIDTLSLVYWLPTSPKIGISRSHIWEWSTSHPVTRESFLQSRLPT